jgi:hypothetical protein
MACAVPGRANRWARNWPGPTLLPARIWVAIAPSRPVPACRRRARRAIRRGRPRSDCQPDLFSSDRRYGFKWTEQCVFLVVPGARHRPRRTTAATTSGDDERHRQLVRDAHTANQLVDLFPTMAGAHRGPKTVAGTARIAPHWQPARWERFRQQHGHDLEPLLDACKRMERGSRRDGVFSTPSRATWQAQQACYSHYSCNNAREGTPVC